MPVLRVLACALAVLALAPQAAGAATSVKKGIWGPVRLDGVSQFPVYKELGAGVYNISFRWSRVAARRPENARDPRDPAYTWPALIDDAVAEAARYGIRMAVMVKGTPGWANGGRTDNWAPDRARDYADFMAAAARRYPTVRYWVVWGEPTRQANFQPLPAQTPHGKPLTRPQRAAPHRYARLLDLAYGAIKRVRPRALVVGGNTFSYGDIGPVNWIKNLRLPSGKPPRMDLYGHNPFGPRRPDLSKDPLYPGTADFCDLDDVKRLVDRHLGRTPQRRRIDLWIGEYAIPTQQGEFSFWVSEATQASWLKSALRITRRDRRIATMNWLTLIDSTSSVPEIPGTWFGLMAPDGRRKPSFDVFKRG